MPRLARVVLPGIPHHVTQRGVRSMPIFQHDADRMEYLRLLGEEFRGHNTYLLFHLPPDRV